MKYILKMAFRNIKRNKRRTFLSAFAISVAVMVVLIMKGYIGGVIDSMFDSVTKIATGHIKIAHTKYLEREDMMPLEYKIDGFDGGGYDQLIPILESIQEIKTYPLGLNLAFCLVLTERAVQQWVSASILLRKVL